MEPLLTNERAEREWLYIIQSVGEEMAIASIAKLNKQKAFPLNIAKILKIKLPAEQFLPDTQEMKQGYKQAHIKGINALRNALKN